MIQTVTGPVAPESLGITLAHEHFLLDLRCLWDPPPAERRHLVDAPVGVRLRAQLEDQPYQCRDNLLLDSEADALEELKAYREAGGTTVIDMTVDGLRPDPVALRRLSQQSGVRVVLGTGVYRAVAHPPWVRATSVEQLTERFVRGLRTGVGDTPVRAGLLGELGTSSPIHPDEVKVLRAAARAHLRTGVSINVHPAIWHREGPRILDILQAEGVDLRRVALSHMDELLDYDYHCSLAVRGAWLSLDTFGSEFTFGEEREPTDRERIAHLLRLLEAGWAGQILLSQDVCTKLQLTRLGGNGYSHVLSRIVPALQDVGVDERTVRELLVDNPRRFLAGETDLPAPG